MSDITVKFVHASWCGNCRAFEPILKEAVSETGVNFEDIDAEKNMDLCEKEGIMNLPVTLIVKGDKKERIDGVIAKDILIDKLKSF